MTRSFCLVSSVTYRLPLDASLAKKFGCLSSLGTVHVIGFSQDARPRRWTDSNGVRFYLLPRWQTPLLRYLAFLSVPPLLVWLALVHGVTIVIAQSPHEGFAAALVKAGARLLGKHMALVVESHGDFEASTFLRRRTRFYLAASVGRRKAAAFALRRADILRSVSGSTASQLRAFAPDKPLVTFTTWTDIEVFHREGIRESRRRDSPSTRSTLLFAGVLVPGKGVHHLVKAFADLGHDDRRLNLIIAGAEEDSSYAADLHRLVDRRGLAGQVEFAGPVSQTELARMMSQADLVVVPSLSESGRGSFRGAEGLPRVILEAMAAGTPVVATRVAGIPEVVADGKTGLLVDPGDEEQLRQSLRWALDHPDELREMAKRGRARALSFASPSVYAEGYRQLLNMAAGVIDGIGSRRAE